MKRLVKGIVAIVVCALLIMACGAKPVEIDYADEVCFEEALNAGENLEGKIVQFTAREFHPDSALGYNVWAGEHLNFISSRNPDIKEGDVVTVRTNTIESSLGSWIITYEKVDNAVIGENTISSADDQQGKAPEPASEETNEDKIIEEQVNDPVEDGSNTDNSASFGVGKSEEAQALELTDYGWYIMSGYGDTGYVEFCGMIHNPNESLIAEFPKVIVTIKNGDGSILATEEQTGSIVMPGDTITLCGMMSVPVADVTEDAVIGFDVDWNSLGKSSSFYQKARTSDFEITNVSEKNGNENYITGEITNNFSEDVDSVNLSIVLRKDGEIVFMENTFLDNLRSGQTKAFEFQRYEDWPDHDSIDVSAMVW